MKEKINEEVLCVLRKNIATNQIEIGYVDIVSPFDFIIEKFVALCDNPKTTIQQMVYFIQSTRQLDHLCGYYNYCVSLNGIYQAFSANTQDTIKEINEKHQWMLLSKRENPDTYDIDRAVEGLKYEIKNKYILWSKAFAIKRMYTICRQDKSILTFSHRMDGWSNPVYQLTSNFSVEINTNFGYGSVSYFYSKLKYKNIDITPFSEWVDYEFAQFSEIIRYSQSYILRNEYWLDAMEYSRDACNLSLVDEVKFVEKYVIDECEKMVRGLENILNKEYFMFNPTWLSGRPISQILGEWSGHTGRMWCFQVEF
jgi:hypothetical protein